MARRRPRAYPRLGIRLGRDRASRRHLAGNEGHHGPASHGSWLAEHIPHARARFHEGHGHFGPVVVMLDRILDELLEVVR
jgi:hypothetical protein